MELDMPGESSAEFSSMASDRIDIVRSSSQGKPKAAEVLAGRLLERISNLGWPAGAVLGGEAELIEEYGVSRSVFREAVRLLEHQSIAKMRRGPGGGLVVAEPDATAAARAVSAYLNFANVSSSAVFEARLALEQVAVQLVAERITESGIARLRSVLVSEERTVDSEHIHDLHLEIAELSGNPVLKLFIEVLISLSQQRPVQGLTADEDRLSRALNDSHHAHSQLVDALSLGDAEVATQRMRKHLSAIWTARVPAAMRRH